MLVYVYGVPGSGKTLLCRTIARVLRPALHLEELPSEMDWGILHDLLETLRSTLLTVVDVDDRRPEDELMVLDLVEPRRVLVVTGRTSKGGISKDDSPFMHTADVVIQALSWTPTAVRTGSRRTGSGPWTSAAERTERSPTSSPKASLPRWAFEGRRNRRAVGSLRRIVERPVQRAAKRVTCPW